MHITDTSRSDKETMVPAEAVEGAAVVGATVGRATVVSEKEER